MRFQTMLMAGILAAGPPAVLAQDAAPIIGNRVYERVATVNDPPRISLWAADSYGRDSRSRVYFRTDASAYVTVLALSERGEMRVIYPRSPASTTRVRGNQAVLVQLSRLGPYEGPSYGGRLYVLAIASPVPFDFSEYARGRSWRDAQLAGVAYHDPEAAVEDFANRTIPDPDVQYSYEILSLGDRQYDRYSSRSQGYGGCYGYAGYSSYSGYSEYPDYLGYSGYTRHLFPAYAYTNYVHLSAFHPWMFGLTSYGYGDCYGTPYRFVILVPPRPQISTPPRDTTDTTRRAIPKWTKVGSRDSTRGPSYEPVSKTPPVQGTFPPGRGRRTDPTMIEGDGGSAQPSRDRRAVHTGNARRDSDRAPIVPRDEPRQSEPTRAEPREVEPKYEPVRSEPVRSEPVRSEPVRSEPVRSEPRQAEPKYEPVRSEPPRSEPARSEPTRSEPALSERKVSEPARSESKRSEPSRRESKRSETKRSEPSRSQPRASSTERRSVFRKN